MQDSRSKGYFGESYAAHWLIKNGFEVISRNFQLQQGEIDIIALKSNTIHFIEVKSWYNIDADNLRWSVNRKKQDKIRYVSQIFLERHAEYDDHYISYDLFFLSRMSGEIDHLVNVF